MKRMVCNIGYGEWACDPHDAVLLLDVAARMVPVKHKNGYSGPMIQDIDRDPFVTAFSMHDIEDPEPPGPETPVEPPAPLQITEQRKIGFDSDTIPL